MIHDKKNVLWLYTLNGPGSTIEPLIIDNEKNYYIFSCKPHECEENQIEIIYNPNKEKITGIIMERRKAKWLTNTSECTKKYFKFRQAVERLILKGSIYDNSERLQ